MGSFRWSQKICGACNYLRTGDNKYNVFTCFDCQSFFEREFRKFCRTCQLSPCVQGIHLAPRQWLPPKCPPRDFGLCATCHIGACFAIRMDVTQIIRQCGTQAKVHFCSSTECLNLQNGVSFPFEICKQQSKRVDQTRNGRKLGPPTSRPERNRLVMGVQQRKDIFARPGRPKKNQYTIIKDAGRSILKPALLRNERINKKAKNNDKPKIGLSKNLQADDRHNPTLDDVADLCTGYKGRRPPKLPVLPTDTTLHLYDNYDENLEYLRERIPESNSALQQEMESVNFLEVVEVEPLFSYI